MNEEQKPKRHVNPANLAIVLLFIMAIIFACTLLYITLVPNRTVSENDDATITPAPVATATSETTPNTNGGTTYAKSYTPSNASQSSEDDIRKNMAKVITDDIAKTLPDKTISTVDYTGLSVKKNGGDTYQVNGTYKYKDGQNVISKPFEYTLTVNGTSYTVKEKNIHETDSGTISSADQAEDIPADLQPYDSYDNIHVNSGLTVTAKANSGRVRVDAVDQNGNTKTIFDKTGPFNDTNTYIAMDPGTYTIKMYTSSSDWDWHFEAN